MPVEAAQRPAGASARTHALATASAGEGSEAADALPLRSLQPELAVEGRLFGRDAAGVRHRVTLPVHSAPQRYRRAWSYARLAEHLGCSDAVPTTQLWHLGAKQLAALAGAKSDTYKALRRHLVLDHDGSVPMLIEQIGQGRLIKPGSVQLLQLEELAKQPEPLSPRQLAPVRSWVCVVTLDYISGHIGRRHWLWHKERELPQAVENERSFAGYVSPDNSAQAMHRLSQIRRFPRGLYDALLDRSRHELPDRLDALPFVDRVLGPRQRADLGDRMAAVLSLIHARILQYGEEVALAL